MIGMGWEISKAQDRLTALLQNVYKNCPQYREIMRLIMSTVGRGGEGDVGQRIRDEILVIQRNNDWKGGIMEQWHQKLHSNTSPNDVVICQVVNCHESVIYILAPLGYATVYGCSDATIVLGAVGKVLNCWRS